ncbi:MAG: LiaI-LiaF-like domain-containing protein [Candidatus Dormibacteraceae bacterium]
MADHQALPDVSFLGVRRYRSFFWPAVLILIGILALLVNSGAVSTDRLSLLADLWPVILIVIGLELLTRRGLHGQPGDVAAVLIVLLAAGGTIAYVALAPNPRATGTLDSSGPIGSLEQATLELDAGAATVTVAGSSSLDGDLYRAHITYSGTKPQVNLGRSNGRLQISQSSSAFGVFKARRFTLDLQISSSVPWTITSNGAASTETYNLNGLPLRSIEINTGASREDISLGTPSGVVPITINGGALTVHLHRPAGTGASVNVSGGAVSLEFDGHRNHAIGTVQESTGTETDMYRVDVSGGACNVTMDVAAPSV